MDTLTFKIDSELEHIIIKRTSSVPQKITVIGTGITSSHLGDERNIREFIIANQIVSYLREKHENVVFYLFDYSYDPLNYRQLRVAVNKDQKLLDKFEKYCGMPISLIPDPYDCHSTYSAHFQSIILRRFHDLDIYPNMIDIYSAYQSGMYDFAKEIVFIRYKEILDFLKKNFPNYKMKKLFYPICSKCLKLEGVDIKRIRNGRITVECPHCSHRFTQSWKDLKGKFSWKIDVAIKWNIFKVDFEPYSKAYLDPDVGSYFIAKKLSEEFFGGYYPENINYGQIIMDKSLSYKILASLPKEAFYSFFIQNRKKDMELSETKFVQFAHNYKIDNNLSFYDYIMTLLPYDLFNRLQSRTPMFERYLDNGIAFAKNFLNRDVYPKLPTKELLLEVPESALSKIRKLFLWVIHYKIEYPDNTIDVFFQEFTTYLKENNLNKSTVFPVVRKLVSQEHSLPIYKIFYFAPLTYLSGCLLMMTQFKTRQVKERSSKYTSITKS